jgi:prepilin-type N-terminal cleavage/methylation domain-containing protein
MKQMMLQSKQKGFTLLELLVVITLLAVLSVGALVAYEGVGDNAQATAAANNTVTADGAIRNYRAVTGNYPDQWDNLSAPATGLTFDGLTEVAADAAEVAGTPLVVARATRDTFGDFNIAASTLSAAFAVPFEGVGVGTLQEVATVVGTVSPNLQHNEGANLGNGTTTGSIETDIDAAAHVSIVPVYGNAAVCTAGGQTISTPYNGTFWLQTMALSTKSMTILKLHSVI